MIDLAAKLFQRGNIKAYSTLNMIFDIQNSNVRCLVMLLRKLIVLKKLK